MKKDSWNYKKIEKGNKRIYFIDFYILRVLRNGSEV